MNMLAGRAANRRLIAFDYMGPDHLRPMMPAAVLLALGTCLLAAEESTKVNPKDGLLYIRIAAGKYVMGCSAEDDACFSWERPAREIVIPKSFWIGRTEVTQKAYRRVTGTNPSRYRGEQLPVDQISWYDARKYCQAIGMRLPREAEWEYAARGGTASARYASLDEIAWHDGNSHDTTHPVGTKQPNGYGLYDTLGNVWVWVEDSYEGDPNKRLLRGDSLFNRPEHVRVSDRLWALPETAHRDMGVRCAGD
jgi:sulfatase modifying factor 1